jgi:hypothetical protein
MNKKQKILTLVALVIFIVLGAFHYLAVTDVYYRTPTSWGACVAGNFSSEPRYSVGCEDALVHAWRYLHRVVFLAAKIKRCRISKPVFA